MCTLRCTATLPVRGEHSMKHSGRRLPLQYTLFQRREFTSVRSFKPGQISVKPSFWLSLSTSMALLVQLETLLQPLHHSHPTADRIALLLPLELGHHIEIRRLSCERRCIVKVLGRLLQHGGRFALSLGARDFCRHDTAYPSSSLVARSITPWTIWAARSFNVGNRVSVSALPSSAAFR